MHAGPAYDVAFSPDGRTVATTGDDSQVRIWEAATGTPVGPATGSIPLRTPAAGSARTAALLTTGRETSRTRATPGSGTWRPTRSPRHSQPLRLLAFPRLVHDDPSPGVRTAGTSPSPAVRARRGKATRSGSGIAHWKAHDRRHFLSRQCPGPGVQPRRPAPCHGLSPARRDPTVDRTSRDPRGGYGCAHRPPIATPQPCTAVRFSPDGRRLAIACDRYLARVRRGSGTWRPGGR